MNAHILCGETIMRLPSARVAKGDVEAFVSSVALLERGKTLHDEAQIAATQAEQAGYERGKQAALAEMREALGKALADLARGFAAENERRDHDTVAAAMQVVARILGDLDDARIITGLASEALRKAGAGAVTITVAPQWVDTVGTQMGLTVNADPALDPFGCRVESNDGRIIADLEIQLAALRERWGLHNGKNDA